MKKTLDEGYVKYSDPYRLPESLQHFKTWKPQRFKQLSSIFTPHICVVVQHSGSPQVCLTQKDDNCHYSQTRLTNFQGGGMELWVTSGHGSNVWDIFMYCNSTAWWDTDFEQPCLCPWQDVHPYPLFTSSTQPVTHPIQMWDY